MCILLANRKGRQGCASQVHWRHHHHRRRRHQSMKYNLSMEEIPNEETQKWETKKKEKKKEKSGGQTSRSSIQQNTYLLKIWRTDRIHTKAKESAMRVKCTEHTHTQSEWNEMLPPRMPSIYLFVFVFVCVFVAFGDVQGTDMTQWRWREEKKKKEVERRWHLNTIFLSNLLDSWTICSCLSASHSLSPCVCPLPPHPIFISHLIVAKYTQWQHQQQMPLSSSSPLSSPPLPPPPPPTRIQPNAMNFISFSCRIHFGIVVSSSSSTTTRCSVLFGFIPRWWRPAFYSQTAETCTHTPDCP